MLFSPDTVFDLFVWIYTFHGKKWHGQNMFMIKIQTEKNYDSALSNYITMIWVML